MPEQDNRDGAGAELGWQAQKSAATRNAILDSAIACIVEFGYRGTTTTAIAQKAGLSRGAMLHHFPSKLDIVRGAVEHLHKKRLKAFRKAMTPQRFALLKVIREKQPESIKELAAITHRDMKNISEV